METFKKFFDASKERFTPNTRTHHQNPIRSIDRKHQNQVARCYGVDGMKEDPLVNRIVKNDKKGNWNISNADGIRLAKTYRIKHTPDKNYKKSLNRTGISLSYDFNSKKFKLSRK